jgi:hypothetical protein
MQPRVSAADRAAIDRTLDVFVNHAVKRHHPEQAYDVLTASMKSGMTRAQWAHGDIPVYPYPAKGARFHGWTVQYRTRDEISIELILSPTARQQGKLGQILFNVYLHPSHGRWLVDSFMPGATFAPIGKPGVVQAARDFTGNPSAQTYNRGKIAGKRVDPARISSKYAVIPFAVIVLVFLGLGVWGLVARVRNRRVVAAYERGLRSAPLSIPADGTRARPGHRS